MFLVIGAFSFFAYIWLLLIIEVISPNVIELWEATATFLLFPILMFFAYATDQNWCGKGADHSKNQLDLTSFEEQSKYDILTYCVPVHGKMLVCRPPLTRILSFFRQTERQLTYRFFPTVRLIRRI